MRNSILRTRCVNISSDHCDQSTDEENVFEELKPVTKSKRKKSRKDSSDENVSLDSSNEKETSKLNKSLSSYPRACEFCGKICSYRQVFFAHRKKCNSHTNYADLLSSKSIADYICYYCDKHFNRKFNLQKHIESGVCIKRRSDCCKDPKAHSDQVSNFTAADCDEKEYCCSNCGKVFKKKCNLQRHVNRLVCSDKDAIKRCKLKCWENECSALFYKQIDLVQHLREQHGRTLSIDRLEFPDYEAFQKWKNEENSIKLMNARKLTGSKRSSKGLSYYYVCQFYRKNDTDSTKRKTNRRKSVGIVPNTKCPSRILVKECGSKIHVTYISTHNHDLYDPLEKKPLSMSMKSLVKKRHISGMKFKDECIKAKHDEGAAWEITCGNDDKQRKYVVRRVNETCSINDCVVKCYEEYCCDLCEHLYRCSCSKKNIFCKHMHKIHSLINRGMFIVNIPPDHVSAPASPVIDSYPNHFSPEPRGNEELMYSAQNSLMKLNGYLANDVIQQNYLKEFVKNLQALCDQCDGVIGNATSETHQIMYEPESSAFKDVSKVYDRSKKKEPCDMYRNPVERSFTAPVTETADCLKPVLQPFNINILCLKSLDVYISDRELCYLKSIDTGFSVGWLYDAVIDSFLSIICSNSTNIYVVDTRVSQYVLNDQCLPDFWKWITWNTIDMLFVPCKPIKNHWLLFIILLKESKLYVLDPSTSLDSVASLFKKYPAIIDCWCNVLKNFFGIFPCDITSLPHTKQNEPYNCAVFICWYAFQYVNKYSLTDDVNTDVFRKFMYDTVVNGSQAV